jgi:hypothetical protein
MTECCECIHAQRVIMATDEENDEIYDGLICEFDEPDYPLLGDERDEPKDCEDFKEGR